MVDCAKGNRAVFTSGLDFKLHAFGAPAREGVCTIYPLKQIFLPDTAIDGYRISGFRFAVCAKAMMRTMRF